MARIRTWVTTTREDIGSHKVVRMVPRDEAAVNAGVTWAAAVVPRHYVSADEIAAVLRELGKPEAAEVLNGKLPVSKRTRSGELGEILGTHYVARELGYRMIARLRWKDSREMPMRGDDLLGVRMVDDDKLEFLKGEAKSRASLSTSTLDEAETALLSEHGLPERDAAREAAPTSLAERARPADTPRADVRCRASARDGRDEAAGEDPRQPASWAHPTGRCIAPAVHVLRQQPSQVAAQSHQGIHGQDPPTRCGATGPRAPGVHPSSLRRGDPQCPGALRISKP